LIDNQSESRGMNPFLKRGSDRDESTPERGVLPLGQRRGRDDVRRLADEYAALRRVAALVAHEARPAEVFAAVAEEIAHVLDVPRIGILRYESDGTATEVGGWSKQADLFPVGTQWTLEAPSGVALVAQSRRPARIDDYANLPGAVAELVRAAAARSGVGVIRSELAVPITVGRDLWGAVVALSTDPQPLPAATEDRLANFTELLATAISNAQARDDLRRLAEEQGALRRVATLIARGAGPAEIFAAVAKEVAQVLHVPLASVHRYEANGTSTRIGFWGREKRLPVGSRLTPHPGIVELVFNTGRSARIDDFSDIPGPTAEELRDAGIRSGVGAPIVVDGEVWGVIAVASTDREPLPSATEARLADFTELVATAISNTQARDDLRRLVDEQVALRRVATLVARGAESSVVFEAVCEETGRVIGATSVNLAHFTPDRFSLTMAGWSLRDTHVPTGTRLPLEGDTINVLILRSGVQKRVESYEGATGELAALIRQRGIRSEIGAPVVVDGRVWGALIAGWDTDEPAHEGTESRLAKFAELIGTAVSNATARSELMASRARIVAATDEARRRIERDLHDGTQQRLVSLGLELQMLKAKIPTGLKDAHQDLERVGQALDEVLENVREISHGIHPAILYRGLGPALRALARRSPVQVELEGTVPDRLPQSIEIAVYYVVSEALANVAKHAQASLARVTVKALDRRLRATVRDNGVGGADVRSGSGLAGLVDRVEALGGRFTLESPPGHGTTISIELPLIDQPTEEWGRRSRIC
jgi:signal transduction histidine kinase